MPDMTLDLRNLRYAILAAERGSFRKAAAEIGIQQSTLSRRVKVLEHRLGTAIFERNPSGVRLTSAGELFLRDAELGAVHFQRAVQAVTSISRGDRGELRIGLCTSLAAGFVGDVVEQYRERYEGIDVQFEEATSERSLGSVVNGKIDIAFVTGTPKVQGCLAEQLWQERVFVALPSGHPLAVREKLQWGEIRDERFIVSAGALGPEIYDYLIKRLSGLGFHPDIRSQKVGRENLMNMVARGFGLTVTTNSTLGTSFAGLVFLPIAGDADIVPCSSVWSSNNSNPALQRLLAVARAVAQDGGYLRQSGVDT